ncbi:MAG TPA: DGQHR domain-containing protein [Abditibacteriaceae bacterium]|jgi:DGQHR domain-containing protein
MAEFQCKALQVRQPNATFYVASVKAADLMSICRPLKGPERKRGIEVTEEEQLTKTELKAFIQSLESPQFQTRSSEVLAQERQEPYQRFLDEKRSLAIASYLKEPDSLLPNSIILAVDNDLDVEDVLKQPNAEVVSIHLPRSKDSAVILDGQHRVDAFNYLPSHTHQEFQVAVTFLIGLPFYQQAELFAIINGKQKPVSKSIIYDLYGYAPVSGEAEVRLYEGLMAVARFCSHVTRILNSAKESPWQNRIKMRGPGEVGDISQAAVVDYLTPLVQPRKYTRRLQTLPLLYEFFADSTPTRCAALLIVYLAAIRAAQPEQWADRNSLLWKNNGVAVIFRVLHDELLLAHESSALMRSFEGIVSRWRKVPNTILAEPPRTGGGGIQNELYERLRASIFTEQERRQLETDREQLREALVQRGALIKLSK